MELFSERYGFTRKREALQLNSMDEKLRTALYNYLYAKFEHEESGHDMAKIVWGWFWYQTLDTFPTYAEFLRHLKERVIKGAWYAVYDLLEFLIEMDFVDPKEVNFILEKEMAGYRVINGLIVPITDEAELATIEEAVSLPDQFAGVRAHINTALEKLAQKPEPDLRNAIKEAISAVESAARIITGQKKGTLGVLLRTLEQKGLPRALVNAWSSLYGYASGPQGIRHGMIKDESTVDFALAKYMVVACAAFVNFLCMRFAQQNNKD